MSFLRSLFGKKKPPEVLLISARVSFNQSQREEADAFFDKYRFVSGEHLFEEYLDFIIGNTQSITISNDVLSKMEKDLAERKMEDQLLSTTAELNNKGIAFEKEGKIDEAIKCYEENICVGYTATHSYLRLAVLCRKRKLFAQEIRVLNRMIEVYVSHDKPIEEDWLKRKKKAIKFLQSNPQ